MITSIRALIHTIQDYIKYRNSKPRFIFGSFSFANQFRANYISIRHHRCKYCCTPMACFIIGVIALIVGLSAPRKADTCIYNQTFDRWECCKEITSTPTGQQCATGQKVTMLINP